MRGPIDPMSSAGVPIRIAISIGVGGSVFPLFGSGGTDESLRGRVRGAGAILGGRWCHVLRNVCRGFRASGMCLRGVGTTIT